MIGPAVRWRSQRPALAVGVAAVALGALGACDAGAPTRGFGSRQLVASRDTTLELVTWTSDRRLFYSTGTSGDVTYWSISLDGGTPTNLGPQFPIFSASDRFACTWESSSDTGDGSPGSSSPGYTLIVEDQQTGMQTSIPNTVFFSTDCPTAPEQIISLLRMDDAGKISVWTGPYDNLQQATADVAIDIMLGLTAQNWIVLAATTAAPQALGVFVLDRTTLTSTVLVAPTEGAAAWAAGATPEGPLDSTSLTDAWNPAPPPTSVGGHLGYARTVSDGGVTVFVGPLGGTPQDELALFRVHGQTSSLIVLTAPALNVPVLAAWQEYDDAAHAQRVLIWDDGQQRLSSCAVPGQAQPLYGFTAPATGQLAFGPTSVESGFIADNVDLGPLLLAFPPPAGQAGAGDVCTVVAASNVGPSGFSPDGARLYWVVVPDTGDRQLWVAAADGSGPRQIGTGDIVGPHFITSSRLEIYLAGDLVWVDVLDDPVQVHDVAINAFGFPIEGDTILGNHIVVGYDWSSQDSTGTLGVVDRDGGSPRVISQDVRWYEQVTLPGEEAGAGTVLGVVYLVHGRNPTPQDGLWLAKITAEDLR
jgi:hypothetical protein